MIKLSKHDREPSATMYAVGARRFLAPTLHALSSRRRDRAKRAGLLAAIIAGHLLVLLWLITRPQEQARSHGGGNTLTLISVAGGKRAVSPPAVSKPPRPVVRPAPVIVIPSAVSEPVDAQPSTSGAAGGPQLGEAGGCGLAGQTAEAIASDPAAMAELAALPPAYRTSADAVMLWNGQWIEISPATTGAPIAPSLRHVVEQVVRDASSECRDAVMGGPQFLAIAEPNRTTMLVIGSGMWRWSDLLLPPAPCDPVTLNACPTPPMTSSSINYLNVGSNVP